MKLSDIEKQIENELISTVILLEETNLNSLNDNESLSKLNIKELSVLIKKKAKELLENTNKNKITEEIENYEELLVKLERDIRQHIKIEFQLKIYIDSLESKADSLEREVKLTKEENNLNIDKIAKLNEKVKTLEDKLKKSNQLTIDLKKQIKSNITNNINIRNNNTIQYLGNNSINQMLHSNNTLTEDTKDCNLTHENELLSNTKILKDFKINRSNNNHKSNKSSDVINLRDKTPPASERKETIEMKRENLKTLLGTSSKDNNIKTGFTNHSKLLMETISNIQKSNQQKSLQKQGKQYSKEIKSNSLNLSNYALLKSNYNKHNNSNLKTETYHNIISKPVASSIANHKNTHSNKIPVNMKNMSTISSIIGKNSSLGSYNFNMTKDLQKSDNSALKSYICKLSDKKQLNSKNLKTIF